MTAHRGRLSQPPEHNGMRLQLTKSVQIDIPDNAPRAVTHALAGLVVSFRKGLQMLSGDGWTEVTDIIEEKDHPPRVIVRIIPPVELQETRDE